MSWLLLARPGIETIVLEKHADFLLDFRGDTIHPSTLQLFHELGLLGQLLERDHVKLPVIHARVAGETIPVADFRHLPVAAPYTALMPQWHFLDFVAEAETARASGRERVWQSLSKSGAAGALIKTDNMNINKSIIIH